MTENIILAAMFAGLLLISTREFTVQLHLIQVQVLALYAWEMSVLLLLLYSATVLTLSISPSILTAIFQMYLG